MNLINKNAPPPGKDAADEIEVSVTVEEIIEAEEASETTTGQNYVRPVTGGHHEKPATAKLRAPQSADPLKKKRKRINKTSNITSNDDIKKERYPKTGERFLYDEQFLENKLSEAEDDLEKGNEKPLK